MNDILFKADEKFEHKYELKQLGYDLDRIAASVAEIYGIEDEDIFLKGKQKKKLKRGVFFVFGLLGNWEFHLLN